jgi:anti-sigma factor RsiW
MTTAKDNIPSEIELLLPWYAAGALSPDQTQQVEAALASDPELASRYEWVRAEFAEETTIGDAAGEPSADGAAALFAKIDALPTQRRSAAVRSFSLGARIAEFFASLTPRTVAWSAAAAALVIALQAGLLAGFAIKEHSGSYETASAPVAGPGEGSAVLIRFQPQARAADISAFLASNKLSIVAGPFGGQLFRVRVTSTKLAKADLARTIATLQDNKVVGFIAAAE